MWNLQGLQHLSHSSHMIVPHCLFLHKSTFALYLLFKKKPRPNTFINIFFAKRERIKFLKRCTNFVAS
ncbi:hypothetical protein GLOIN_2v1563251 [Rhizophagus irregularis DAOM 181602=DAOM 197198]|uniref:Uncharacterized protein n=1 Tax=Rhizophagus irregularis (strain DAOM 181602 / DAOM 197198 / MUCL 43194) TaxID=747089 RepID=A0A2P4QD40_RHIID|nr:hypothetical protein GLOIN_2v1563251 [Rhizophagus irregularis DAOM 181602=DAOM 197198]POG75561.1 hypothetical protein GLOIN_2v1563251 [Rhizophagus irregularis DAOM 181602=DAOM 197198]GET67043.1 hypothetical protein GLOIN_2v1563251 [Rhizophagus irregularis DAOM 181602=DAOM 197198]|eukprot:XP_025182427.1 hypothetical protein GLOIN_2v1563251 [Rhizophagus irregularis DAOM 181602=DAOM 197198]